MWHRVNAPTGVGSVPRYSLVWKLVFVAKRQLQGRDEENGEENGSRVAPFLSICSKKWGSALVFGSAGKLKAYK